MTWQSEIISRNFLISFINEAEPRDSYFLIPLILNFIWFMEKSWQNAFSFSAMICIVIFYFFRRLSIELISLNTWFSKRSEKLF